MRSKGQVPRAYLLHTKYTADHTSPSARDARNKMRYVMMRQGSLRQNAMCRPCDYRLWISVQFLPVSLYSSINRAVILWSLRQLCMDKVVVVDVEEGRFERADFGTGTFLRGLGLLGAVLRLRWLPQATSTRLKLQSVSSYESEP